MCPAANERREVLKRDAILARIFEHPCGSRGHRGNKRQDRWRRRDGVSGVDDH
jgi:hypothetical protein